MNSIKSFITNISKHYIFLLLILFFTNLIYSEDDYFKQRKLMVDTQIISRGIKDKNVISSLLKVRRHEFIPKSYLFQCNPYGDHPVAIGDDQTISQPYIVALMTELLDVKPGHKVLEIGTGSGYQAAILAELKAQVFTIEIIPALAENAKKVLKILGYNKIKIKTGDGYRGWKDHSPFDRIIVTCAPDHVPQPLIDQLVETGKMVIPVGNYPEQTLYLLSKKNGKIIRQSIIPVLFVPMTGEAQK